MNEQREEIEFLGTPMQNTFILHAVKGNEDGRDLLYFSITGTPSTFVVFDVNEKKIIRCYTHGEDIGITHTAASWSSVTDKNGNVYSAVFGEPGYILKYSSGNKSYKSLASIGDESALYHLTCDDNNNIYGGTYPSGKIFKCSPDGVIEDLGSPIPDNRYVISSVYFNNEIYGGTRGEHPVFFRFDLRSRTTKIIPLPDFFRYKLECYYYMTKINDYLFVDVKTNQSDYYILCYNLKDERWTDFCEKSMGGQHISEPLDNKGYFVDKTGYLKSIDIDTLEVSDEGIFCHSVGKDISCLDYANGIMGGGFYKLNDQETYPGYTYISPNYDQNTLAYINLKLKTVEFIDNCNLIKNPVKIRELTGMDNGNILLSAYMGTDVGIYEPEKNEYKYFTCRQSEGMVARGSKAYMGIYTRAVIWEYDANKPYVKEKNPKPLFATGESQDRPFSICNAGENIAIATVPGYGKLGGALTLYNINKKTKKVYRNLIQGQSVTGVCYRDGFIYGTTGIFGGLGSIPTAREAKIFKFSISDQQLIIANSINDALKHNNIYHIGGIGFDCYGELWAICDGVVFTLDSDTLRVKEVIDISGVNWTLESITAWEPHQMIFIDDYLYCNPGKELVKINVKTKEYTKYYHKVDSLTSGKDKNIYFAYNSKFYRLKRN